MLTKHDYLLKIKAGFKLVDQKKLYKKIFFHSTMLKHEGLYLLVYFFMFSFQGLTIVGHKASLKSHSLGDYDKKKC